MKQTGNMLWTVAKRKIGDRSPVEIAAEASAASLFQRDIKQLIDNWKPPRELDDDFIHTEGELYLMSPLRATTPFIVWLIARGWE